MSLRLGERLLALNDVRLAAYLKAGDERARAAEMERLIVGDVLPQVAVVIARHARGEVAISEEDAQDVSAQVTLRMIRKLNAAVMLEEESIQNLAAYVTTLTQNAIHDLQRRRSPERTRLASRLRYLLTHDPSLALWNHDDAAACGLAEWRGRELCARAPRSLHGSRVCDPNRPADAVRALFRQIGGPIRFSQLVALLMDAWNVTEPQPAARPDADATDCDPLSRLTSRQYLEALWEEIELLPPNQRAALLLNLREPGGANAVALFMLVGVAPLERIATCAGMSLEELAAMWDALPFDDLTIAARLGLTRQQVINARKAARQRLGRRMVLRGK
jgi:DNA-directed RNA polymerase specialized sigma24 family protein